MQELQQIFISVDRTSLVVIQLKNACFSLGDTRGVVKKKLLDSLQIQLLILPQYQVVKVRDLYVAQQVNAVAKIVEEEPQALGNNVKDTILKKFHDIVEKNLQS